MWVQIRPKWDWKYQADRSTAQKQRVQIRPKWDWKSDFVDFIPSFRDVQIRPKWDWKLLFLDYSLGFVWLFKSDQNGIESMPRSFLSLPASGVQIRPKWDWKDIYIRIRGNPQWSSNQTKMGLKGITVNAIRPSGSVQIRPKWDWKASIFSGIHARPFKFKSDQNGIERQHSGDNPTLFSQVQIRPKWDWKFKPQKGTVLVLESSNQTKMGLKDNVYYHFSFHRHACSNQTKMGLKVIPWDDKAEGGKEKSSNQTKMGLKVPVFLRFEAKRDSSNQTKMGLKDYMIIIWPSCPCPPVQIRPKWDWKRYQSDQGDKRWG